MFKKIGFSLTEAEINEVVDAKDLAIEQVLFRLKRYVADKERIVTVRKEQQSGGNHKRISGGSNDSKKGGVSSSPLQDNKQHQAKLIKDLTDTVSMLEQKLARMETMLKSKDEKIKELSQRLKDGR